MSSGEFQGHHTNEAYYRSGIMSTGYHSVWGIGFEIIQNGIDEGELDQVLHPAGPENGRYSNPVPSCCYGRLRRWWLLLKM